MSFFAFEVLIIIFLLLALQSTSVSLEFKKKCVPNISIPKNKIPIVAMTSLPENSQSTKNEVSTFAIPNSLKLIISAGGIYAAFLYYGSLGEDIFDYVGANGKKFTESWFLQSIEAFANVIIGGVGMQIAGRTLNLPQDMLFFSGVSQVFAKAFTSMSLASGISFPIVTLAKSGKMVPVMIGSLLLGGAKYSLREYAAVLAIIIGTAIVSLGKMKSGPSSSTLGLAFIVLSLVCDGITGGLQKRLKAKTSEKGVSLKPYDMMFWTNLYMGLTAVVIAFSTQEFLPGLDFCLKNPIILNKILKFAVCSAIGQSFIFFTISNFDPLVCTTVTTTRKVFSVLLSIFLKGHKVNSQGWFGIALASAGILSELQDKGSSGGHHGGKKEDKAKDDKKSQ